MLLVVLCHTLRVLHPFIEVLVRHVWVFAGLHVHVRFDELTSTIQASFAPSVLEPWILGGSAWPKLPAPNVMGPRGPDVRSPEPLLTRNGVFF